MRGFVKYAYRNPSLRSMRMARRFIARFGRDSAIARAETLYKRQVKSVRIGGVFDLENAEPHALASYRWLWMYRADLFRFSGEKPLLFGLLRAHVIRIKAN